MRAQKSIKTWNKETEEKISQDRDCHPAES